MEPAIEAENSGLDRRVANSAIRASPVALEEFTDLKTVFWIEKNHLRANSSGMGVARRLVRHHAVDEHLRTLAGYLDEISPDIAGNFDQPVLVHQAADQRPVAGCLAPPRWHAPNGLFQIAVLVGFCRP